MADAAAFEKAAVVVAQTEGAKASYVLEGLTCNSCANKVSKKLAKIDGVLASAVDYQSGRTEVAYDASKTSIEALTQAIEKTGYAIIKKPEQG